jgi:hypothetical protein
VGDWIAICCGSNVSYAKISGLTNGAPSTIRMLVTKELIQERDSTISTRLMKTGQYAVSTADEPCPSTFRILDSKAVSMLQVRFEVDFVNHTLALLNPTEDERVVGFRRFIETAPALAFHREGYGKELKRIIDSNLEMGYSAASDSSSDIASSVWTEMKSVKSPYGWNVSKNACGGLKCHGCRRSKQKPCFQLMGIPLPQHDPSLLIRWDLCPTCLVKTRTLLTLSVLLADIRHWASMNKGTASDWATQYRRVAQVSLLKESKSHWTIQERDASRTGELVDVLAEDEQGDEDEEEEPNSEDVEFLDDEDAEEEEESSGSETDPNGDSDYEPEESKVIPNKTTKTKSVKPVKRPPPSAPSTPTAPPMVSHYVPGRKRLRPLAPMPESESESESDIRTATQEKDSQPTATSVRRLTRTRRAVVRFNPTSSAT